MRILVSCTALFAFVVAPDTSGQDVAFIEIDYEVPSADLAESLGVLARYTEVVTIDVKAGQTLHEAVSADYPIEDAELLSEIRRELRPAILAMNNFTLADREYRKWRKDPYNSPAPRDTLINVPELPILERTISFEVQDDVLESELLARYGIDRSSVSMLAQGQTYSVELPRNIARVAVNRPLTEFELAEMKELRAISQVDGPPTEARLLSAISADCADGFTEDPQAWSWFRKTANIVFPNRVPYLRASRIAVMDSGVDIDHASLKPALWENPDQQDGGGAANGFNHFKPYQKDSIDDRIGHGTAVTSVATGRSFYSAQLFSESKVWLDKVEVVGVKIAGIDDYGNQSIAYNHIYNGIIDTKHNSRVVNLSAYSPNYNSIVHTAMADSSGQLFVVAAGNFLLREKGPDPQGVTSLSEHRGLDTDDPVFPVVPQLHNKLSVAAMNRAEGRQEYSRYGNEVVDIAAPGEHIRVAVAGSNSFGCKSGTSFAAPLVSLTAAILFSRNEYPYAFAVKQRILAACDWRDSWNKFVVRGCVLNFRRTISTDLDSVKIEGSAPLEQNVSSVKFEPGGGQLPICSNLQRLQGGGRVLRLQVDTFPTARVLIRDKNTRSGVRICHGELLDTTLYFVGNNLPSAPLNTVENIVYRDITTK